jgi:hypothetical protein
LPLGTERTLIQFYEHTGVDFSTGSLSAKATRGGLP